MRNRQTAESKAELWRALRENPGEMQSCHGRVKQLAQAVCTRGDPPAVLLVPDAAYRTNTQQAAVGVPKNLKSFKHLAMWPPAQHVAEAVLVHRWSQIRSISKEAPHTGSEACGNPTQRQRRSPQTHWHLAVQS